jgi:hypothetical protein
MIYCYLVVNPRVNRRRVGISNVLDGIGGILHHAAPRQRPFLDHGVSCCSSAGRFRRPSLLLRREPWSLSLCWIVDQDRSRSTSNKKQWPPTIGRGQSSHLAHPSLSSPRDPTTGIIYVQYSHRADYAKQMIDTLLFSLTIMMQWVSLLSLSRPYTVWEASQRVRPTLSLLFSQSQPCCTATSTICLVEDGLLLWCGSVGTSSSSFPWPFSSLLLLPPAGS